MSRPEPARALRPARASEAQTLSEIAFRSKAHWGYSAEFIDACRAELSISAGEIERRPTFVLEEAGVPLGFYSLEARPPREIELTHLFVEPSRLGGGRGFALLEHAATQARALGHRVMLIQSDPNAEGFYTSFGATRVGEQASDSIAGRFLPLLELSLDKPE